MGIAALNPSYAHCFRRISSSFFSSLSLYPFDFCSECLKQRGVFCAGQVIKSKNNSIFVRSRGADEPGEGLRQNDDVGEIEYFKLSVFGVVSLSDSRQEVFISPVSLRDDGDLMLKYRVDPSEFDISKRLNRSHLMGSLFFTEKVASVSRSAGIL